MDKNMETITNPVQDLNGSETSEIQKYFDGLTIFITGATGFLGSLLVEKLLRSCPDVKKIYILMRPKKNESGEDRFLQYFQQPVFEILQRENPKVFHKVEVLLGNCDLPNLGLSCQSRYIITSEVNCIMHLAATVRFDEKLRIAAHINIRSILDLLQIAKETENLSSIVYVSTAFSNCINSKIDEVFYKPHISGKQLLSLIDQFSDELLEKLTRLLLLDKWPNTYVFTKTIAEDLVKTESENLPISIIRPSIVVATAHQPIPGWINNLYGVTGVIAGAGIGLMRSLHCNPKKVADIIPADYVINNIIATAWSTAEQRKIAKVNDINNEKISRNILIYNCVSGSQNPITWGKIRDELYRVNIVLPFTEIWYPFLFMIPYKFLQIILHCAVHQIPAYLIDSITSCTGKGSNLVKTYKQIKKYSVLISYFAMRQWDFENKNTQELWNRLNTTDQNLFYFSVENLQWNLYFYDFVKGIRLYVLKDPLETLPQAHQKHRILKYVHYFVITIFALSFSYIIFQLYHLF